MAHVTDHPAQEADRTLWSILGWPLFFAGVPFGGWSSPGLLLLMGDWIATRRRIRTDLPAVYKYAVAGLIIVFIVTSFLASHRVDAFGTALGYTWTLTFGAYYAFRLARTGRTPAVLQASMWPLPVTAAAHALLGIYQYFELGRRAAGTTVNPNQYGTLMVIALFLGLAYLLAQRSRIRWLAVPYGVIILGGLFASGSRGAWVGLAAGLVVVGLLAFRRLYQEQGGRTIIALVAGLLLAVMAGTLAYNLAPPRTQSRIRSMVSISSNMDRITIYQSMVPLIRDHFWFGVGLNNLKYKFGEYRVREKMPIHGLAHNMILQVWGDIGIFGLLLSTLLIGFWLVRGLPLPQAPPELWWLYGLLIGLIARDQFDGALTILNLNFLFNWLGATVVGLRLYEEQETAKGLQKPAPSETLG